MSYTHRYVVRRYLPAELAMEVTSINQRVACAKMVEMLQDPRRKDITEDSLDTSGASAFLVDEVGDKEGKNSRWWLMDENGCVTPLPIGYCCHCGAAMQDVGTFRKFVRELDAAERCNAALVALKHNWLMRKKHEKMFNDGILQAICIVALEAVYPMLKNLFSKDKLMEMIRSEYEGMDSMRSEMEGGA